MTLPFTVRARPGPACRVLGIDPGTRCGYAIVETDGLGGYTVDGCGTWDLSPGRGRGEHPGLRYRVLLDQLGEVVHQVDRVAFERVYQHKGTDAAHVYGGVVAVVLVAAELAQRPCVEVGVGKVKQRACGRGNARKHEVQQAAATVLGRVPSPDEADALFVALAAADLVPT